MIRRTITYLLFILLTASSCNKMPAEMQLDKLNDKEEYTGGVTVWAEEYQGNPVSEVYINGNRHHTDEPLELPDAGFYSIRFTYYNPSTLVEKIIRIVVLDEERGDAEWGLKKWTPKNASYQKQPGNITMVYPAEVPPGARIPVIFIAGEEITQSRTNLHVEAGATTFNIKNGIGAWLFTPEELFKPLLIGDQDGFEITSRISGQDAVVLQGNLSGDSIILDKMFYRISADLHIPEQSVLVIRSRSFITVDPGVNIYNRGHIVIKGTADEPVTITCSEPGAFWGGFISTGEGNTMRAENTIFCQSGYHTGEDFAYGHAKRQALFYMENGMLSVQNCYMTDHAGQIFYPVNSSVEIAGSLVQRAKTGGQINQSELVIRNTVFTDFPDDGSVYRDEDNDALYIMGSNAVIDHSFFMYAKDDGLDSGGSEGGSIRVTNCHFEATFHEGAALSSGGTVTKNHTFIRCTFENCGQGIELGYSSPNHQVLVDSCTFTGNGVGIRYGDNYTNQHEGTMTIANSLSINNIDKDIWNMLRDSWSADKLKMQFDNVSVSQPYELYPELNIYAQ